MLQNTAAIFLTMCTTLLCIPVLGNSIRKEADCGVSTRYVAHIHTTVRPENAHDGKLIVVIDAGHGGHDPGCIGKNSKEKHIALDIAKKLKSDIKKRRGDIRVIMTREKDVFIPLHKRIAIANKSKADLFISIHCNFVGNPHVCGSETFVMGLHRADDNLEVAKRENSVVLMENDFEKNYDGYDPNSPIGHILLANYQNAFLNSSISLAAEIEKSIGNRAFSKSRGVKQAGFVVLREATMPSVLVESGFLSNAREEAYLLSQEGQNVIAQGITTAIDSFLPIEVKKVVAQKKVKPKSIPKKTKKAIQKKPSTSISEAPIYTIQIGAFSSSKLTEMKAKKGRIDIIEVKTKGIYKYYIGKYTDKNKAQSACILIKENGFKDAFVVKL